MVRRLQRTPAILYILSLDYLVLFESHRSLRCVDVLMMPKRENRDWCRQLLAQASAHLGNSREPCTSPNPIEKSMTAAVSTKADMLSPIIIAMLHAMYRIAHYEPVANSWSNESTAQTTGKKPHTLESKTTRCPCWNLLFAPASIEYHP